MNIRTPAEIHRMAEVSAYHTLQTKGSVTVKDVMDNQGLAELNAKRALEGLRKQGKCYRHGNRYIIVFQP